MQPTLMSLTNLFSHHASVRSVSKEHASIFSRLIRRGDELTTAPPLDEPLLAIQIGGIVGAYVIFIAIILTLLLIVGRRLRRTVQSSNYTLHMEMMKPRASQNDPSPVSPTKMSGFRSWSSLNKAPRSHASNNGSVGTIDEAVVASDRRRAQEEMEMLYAAVMEHDEQRASGSVVEDKESRSPVSVHTNPFSDASRIEDLRASDSQSVKAPLSPRSSSRLSRISNLSLFHSNPRPQSTSGGKLRSPRFPLRKLPISSPMASPDATAHASYGEDQAPLSPRFYNPAPPPPVPSSRTAGFGRTPPAPLNLSPAGHSASSLPFRDAYPLRSAPPTKTTILERPDKLMGGPRTGLPTPYSPYMPQTPLTPLTPSRLVTKREKKREEKENRLRAVNEEDAVQDDQDTWGY